MVRSLLVDQLKLVVFDSVGRERETMSIELYYLLGIIILFRSKKNI